MSHEIEPSRQPAPLANPTAGALLVATAPTPATDVAEALLWRALRGRPLAGWALETLAEAPGVVAVALVVRASRVAEAEPLAAGYTTPARAVQVTSGDPDWRASVVSGLASLPAACAWVLVHDAARPLLTAAALASGMTAARITGVALAGEPVKETLKRVADGHVVETLPRSRLTRLQPPLVIRRDLLERALEWPGAVGLAGLALASGATVRVYDPGGPDPAIASEADWSVAESLLAARAVERGP